MTTTPIRNLVLMLNAAAQRQDAIEAAEKRDDLSREEWAPASRVWSRQQEALSSAIIAEPPQTFDDVLAVLTELAGRHDLITGQGEDATARELRDLGEMTAVAVKNCAVRLATLFRPDDEPTEAQHQALVWVSKQVEQWLPQAEGR
ncbi:hypothetical protein [Sphingomonas paucimobilis]|uniref:Uncharacterized protein n=1 Tax=Sphingomonas paucimobilis TaxID=13689 RepID=A0A7Y2KUH9_SPHPI|nr:hypothetical protein [Sphingomonas paucimobilis]NNG59805.1 hypothetical protein [Sphingomonas paucimobilis]